MRKNIAVIGAGISGLSCALRLCDDHNVTILAKNFSPEITSNRAAAFWFPYHIRNDKRGISWCNESYRWYKMFSEDERTGVSMRLLVKVLRKGVEEEEPIWIDFMPENSYRELDKTDLDPAYAKVYHIAVPLIETQLFLPFLMDVLEKKDVKVQQHEVSSLAEIAAGYDLIINCSALGARALCNDETVIPVRGQVALLEPGEKMPIFLDNEKPLYVVPRRDAIIIGGTYEEHIFDDVTEPATVERLLATAYEAFPQLRRHGFTGSWAGLRPYRPEVRVELEAGTNIIHNYGHGGSGFTLAFGCAGAVCSIVNGLQ